MEKIITKHPNGKKGVNISKDKYDIIRKAIIESLEVGNLSYSSLCDAVEKKLKKDFNGSIRWYVETVKLDLEANNIIKRIRNIKPELYKLTKK